MFTLHDLLALDRTPAPYEPGDEFWNDSYISTQLLPFHLNPDTDLASYKPQTMDAICAYLPKAMGLSPGAAIADLGCGPGLYCAKLSKDGYQMTGVDRSESSLAYARAHSGTARFIRQSYLEPFGEAAFDGAIMISQDFGVLSPGDRKTLLQNIHTALKPGACFAFDVPSLRAYATRTADGRPDWYAAKPGFYRPHDHLVMEKPIPYPEIPAICNRISVLDHEVKTYRFWQTFYSPQTIGSELAACGFRLKQALSDLTGKPFADDSLTIGVIAEKA
ncbi:MAG TPA: methyltransferase domain-containing protein [Candidatus Limiplasma sp.]|nr:methyltransferase domain-containing protein [Candidatus Limiplasma sp.]HRX07820.1 methyltransferase domain-containing protein [Candidatus Limiplasma sp.]